MYKTCILIKILSARDLSVTRGFMHFRLLHWLSHFSEAPIELIYSRLIFMLSYGNKKATKYASKAFQPKKKTKHKKIYKRRKKCRVIPIISVDTYACVCTPYA